jgi:hypothetical protein
LFLKSKRLRECADLEDVAHHGFWSAWVDLTARHGAGSDGGRGLGLRRFTEMYGGGHLLATAPPRMMPRLARHGQQP